MENTNGEKMSREEASKLLEQALMTLAKNAVHNQRLMNYVDQLEYYIATLDEESKREEKKEVIEEQNDEPKAN